MKLKQRGRDRQRLSQRDRQPIRERSKTLRWSGSTSPSADEFIRRTRDRQIIMPSRRAIKQTHSTTANRNNESRKAASHPGLSSSGCHHHPIPLSNPYFSTSHTLSISCVFLLYPPFLLLFFSAAKRRFFYFCLENQIDERTVLSCSQC